MLPHQTAAAIVPSRRTQAERSHAMRERLLTATLESLVEDGYIGTTLSSIVRRAGVSRGAQVHHYPNKQALILDATENLLRRTYKALGTLLLSIADEDNRLEGLIDGTWNELFSIPLHRAYIELLVASQRDKALADALRKLSMRVVKIYEPAVEHYFESTPGSREELKTLFAQIWATLSGMAMQAHLTTDKNYVRTHLKLLSRQMSRHVRARKGVRTPPPRPESWDRPAHGG